QVDCRTPEEIEAERIALQRPRNLTPIDRPRDGESAESTYRKCLNWARTSAQKSPPVRTLTVGYEGLMSYSSSYANKMYKYYDDLAAGINAAMPGKATMSYVASNIIRPNLRESVNKSDFLLLPHTDTTMKPYVAESCIKAWKEVHGSQFKLNIVGHSFGGNSSRKLMQSLNENHPNVTNIEMILVDARSSNPLNYVTNFTTENNVSRNSVFYQKGLVMPGYPFSGPNTSNTRLRGSDLPFINSRCGGLNSHARTTCSPQVHSAFQRMMAR
ncbi:MAG: hypothetical protein K9K67_11540, partial [Bacteriovoracaceae bacterium]|nr:hypothetical protein [Bacteriovoracaceae bacterium]